MLCFQQPQALWYEPPGNKSFQVSQVAHRPLYRQGIFNEEVADVVFSIEGLRVQLTPQAKQIISQRYNGQPLLVSFSVGSQGCCAFCFICCSICCHANQKAPPCNLCCCCQKFTPSSYRDDTTVIKGIWFGKQDLVPPSTCLSGLGCLFNHPNPSQFTMMNDDQCCSCSPPTLNRIFLKPQDIVVVQHNVAVPALAIPMGILLSRL